MSLSDEELILHYYGESEDPAGIERALAASPEDRRRFETLSATLNLVAGAPPPEPAPFFETRLWARVEERIEARRWPGWPRPAVVRPARLGWTLAAALLVLAATFLVGREAGRSDRSPERAAATAGLSGPARERILAAAVAEHLERSERLLVGLENGEDPAGESDRVAELKLDNRLYRLAARQADEPEVAALLEDLERFLLELSHASPDDPAALDALRQRLVAQDLLFRVRIAGERLEPAAGPVVEAGGPTL